jgi:hypothetical protein
VVIRVGANAARLQRHINETGQFKGFDHIAHGKAPFDDTAIPGEPQKTSHKGSPINHLFR